MSNIRSIISSSFSSGQVQYQCKLCGYLNGRNGRTKSHIIKKHLGLRLFSCRHCHQYMDDQHQVINHINETHPGLNVVPQRTFREYEGYLNENVIKVRNTIICDSIAICYNLLFKKNIIKKIKHYCTCFSKHYFKFY